MSLINIRPQELRMAAFRMIFKARSVHSAINTVDKEIKSLDEDTFSGESATRLRMDYQKYRTHLLSSSDLIVRFARSLIDIANDFEKADRKQAFAISLPFLPIAPNLVELFRGITSKWGTNDLQGFPWAEEPESSEAPSGETGGGVVADGGAATENVSHGTGTVYQEGDYLKSDLNTNPPPTKYGTWNGYCAGYVREVVPEVGGVAHAKDWIGVHNLSSFSGNGDLRTQLEPGDVVVWNAGQKGAHVTSGHAAVIVEVHEDHVVLAESRWGGGDFDPKHDNTPHVGRMLDTSDINGLYVWSNPKVNQGQTEVLHG
jgi:uncharacterized protein YukE